MVGRAVPGEAWCDPPLRFDMQGSPRVWGMNPSEKCPFCASTRIVSGKMVAEDYGGYFEPDGIRPPGWRKPAPE